MLHFKMANQTVISFFMTQESQFEGMLQILNGIMNDLLRYCITIVMRAAKWKATFTLQLEVSQF